MLTTIGLVAATVCFASFARASPVFGVRDGCGGHRAFAAAVRANTDSLITLPLTPFGKPETGWAIYAPAIAREAHTACAIDTPGFARALARWQFVHGLEAHGAVDADTFAAMKDAWQARRPFVALRKDGICPDPPTRLADLTPEESRLDRVVQLRPRALKALRRMVAAARREVPEVAADPQLLTVFSGYRDPADDAARCAAELNCLGLVRAECSSHRTGLAVDLVLGAAPGFTDDSSDDANRLYQSRTPAYRWLVANARRFGFINYVFEPWHWEWTGERP
ncbi:D-alanyl-D-alanine carboxypeptidase family protein [Phenylobacterium sp.]|uniref:D-alanyl-D-alanine carboxypeptidase family protein n=1 Tax=Phenylobacterium sp. TaxID=1871053 RepID=UPI002F40702B